MIRLAHRVVLSLEIGAGDGPLGVSGVAKWGRKGGKLGMSASSPKFCVLVLGMHRSGTSALAGALQRQACARAWMRFPRTNLTVMDILRVAR